MASKIRLTTILQIVTQALAVIAFFYHTIFLIFVPQAVIQLQVIHLSIAFILLFSALAIKTKGLWKKLVYLALIVLSVVANFYILYYRDILEVRVGFPTKPDIYIGIILLFCILFLCWRYWGSVITGLVMLFIIYALFGYILPRGIASPKVPWGYVLSYLTTGMTGVFGELLMISVLYIFLFIIFGGMLRSVGVATLITELSKPVVKRIRSGAAQTAVWGSALAGTATGSAVANVFLTGSFTIPMMKKLGYKPSLAGAIEACASSGGQYMPPVMGSAAFLMAYFLGVSYFDIVLKGFIPAILFYISVALSTHFMVCRLGIGVYTTAPEPMKTGLVIRKGIIFILSLTVLMWLMFLRYSPTYAIVWALAAIIVASTLEAILTGSVITFLKETWQSLQEATASAAQIALVLAALGMVSQVFNTTGLGIKLASVLYDLGQGALLPTLIMMAIVLIILGMGMPTSACYLIAAIVAAPGLTKLGLQPWAIHFFIFYFANYSMVTPPVAPAALVASKIAGSSYFETAGYACLLMAPMFLIPVAFAYTPELLAIGSPLAILNASVITAIFILFTECALVGYLTTPLRLWERLILGLAALGLGLYLLQNPKPSYLLMISLPVGSILIIWKLVSGILHARRVAQSSGIASVK